MVIIGLLITWEVYARSGFISKRILPAPSGVFISMYELRDVLFSHTLQTTTETMLGLSLAILLGLAIALSIFYSTALKKAVYPLLVISQTIPLIALAPLLIIWFGFGLFPKVLIVMLYCFFPIAVSTSEALLNTPRHYEELLRTMGASKWQIVKHVNAPYALGGFFTGLKISAVYAVTGAIVGEYVGAYKGLGIYMQTAAHSHAVSLVFAAIFIVIALTLVLLSLVFWMQKLLMPWRHADEKNL
jgi:ABC-type nitrate/sulfonate/bicarbonate transport system permease component